MILMHKSDDGRVPPIEYIECSAMQPKVGMACVISNGKLAKCAADAVPTYICLMEAPAAVAAGTIVPVMRVSKDVIYRTTNSASYASLAKGSKVTLAANGLQVTATTSSGVAEVVDFDGTATGSTVYIRF